MKSINKISSQLDFLLNLATAQAKMARRFDGRLGSLHGLGQNDFRILYYLSQADGEKMRRIDLAEKLGLTASGITRLLMPMEKIGLIKRETTEHDARVSFVLLAPGGKRLLSESVERAELLAEEILPAAKAKKLEEMTEILSELN